MKAFLLTLALGGAALAQTTVPALPVTAPTGATSSTSTVSTSTAATSSAVAPVTLRFSARPGTLVSFGLRVQQRLQPVSVRVEPLPNVRLTADKERERQALEARVQRDFASFPQLPAQTGKVFYKVLPPLADGSPVLLTTTVASLPGGKTLTTRLQQTLRPDGTVKTQLLASGDPGAQRVQGALSGLLNQSNTFGGVSARLLGQPLSPGQSVSQTVRLDLGQLIGGVLGSVGAGGGSGTGALEVTDLTTYRGQDPAGNTLLEDRATVADGRFTVSVPDRSQGGAAQLQFELRDFSTSARSTVRPDGLSAGSSAHVEGGTTLTFPIPDQPFRLVLDLKLVQDVTTTPQ